MKLLLSHIIAIFAGAAGVVWYQQLPCPGTMNPLFIVMGTLATILILVGVMLSLSAAAWEDAFHRGKQAG